MLKGNKHRIGIDDRPLTKEEYERMMAGEHLYVRVAAAQRPNLDSKPEKSTRGLLLQEAFSMAKYIEVPMINDDPTPEELDAMA